MTTSEWQFAVTKMFNVTNWPLMHHVDTRRCVELLFQESYYNQVRDNARILSAAAALLSLLV